MSQYNIKCFLKDFSNRTMLNLEYIEKSHTKTNVFEVTQLINSLLGLIIIPVEAYKANKGYSDDKLKQSSIKDYENIEKIIKKCEDEKRLYCDYYTKQNGGKETLDVAKFVKHIRNSVAHGGNKGIHFYPILEKEDISSVFFYDNYEPNKSKENLIYEFCVKLTIGELKELTKSIANLYCKFDTNPTIYKTEIDKLEKLMTEGRKNFSASTL